MDYPTLTKHDQLALLDTSSNIQALADFIEPLIQPVLFEEKYPKICISDYQELLNSKIVRLYKILDQITYQLNNTSASEPETGYFIIESIRFPIETIDEYRLIDGNFGVYCTEVKNAKEYPIHDNDHLIPENWQELKAIELNLQESIKHSVSVYKEKNTLIIFTNKLTLKMISKIKALQWSIFKDKCSTYNQDVQNLYTGLATEDVDLCNQSIKNILDMPIWAEFKYKSLEKMLKFQKTQTLKTLEETIKADQKRAQVTETNLILILNRLKESQETYFLWEQKKDTVDTEELINYIKNHPYIKEFTIADTTQYLIWLYIEAPILYYDTDIIECLRGLDYQQRIFLDEVFLKKNYIFWARCKVGLHLNTFELKTTQVGVNDKLLRQPHVDAYECTGNHASAIKNWIKYQDYIGCLEQIVAMAFNLNFTDSFVTSRMWEDLGIHGDVPSFQITGTKEFISYKEILRRATNESSENNTEGTNTSDNGSDPEY